MPTEGGPLEDELVCGMPTPRRKIDAAQIPAASTSASPPRCSSPTRIRRETRARVRSQPSPRRGRRIAPPSPSHAEGHGRHHAGHARYVFSCDAGGRIRARQIRPRLTEQGAPPRGREKGAGGPDRRRRRTSVAVVAAAGGKELGGGAGVGGAPCYSVRRGFVHRFAGRGEKARLGPGILLDLGKQRQKLLLFN